MMRSTRGRGGLHTRCRRRRRARHGTRTHPRTAHDSAHRRGGRDLAGRERAAPVGVRLLAKPAVLLLALARVLQLPPARAFGVRRVCRVAAGWRVDRTRGSARCAAAVVGGSSAATARAVVACVCVCGGGGAGHAAGCMHVLHAAHHPPVPVPVCSPAEAALVADPGAGTHPHGLLAACDARCAGRRRAPGAQQQRQQQRRGMRRLVSGPRQRAVWPASPPIIAHAADGHRWRARAPRWGAPCHRNSMQSRHHRDPARCAFAPPQLRPACSPTSSLSHKHIQHASCASSVPA
jgi:hypothetical protein